MKFMRRIIGKIAITCLLLFVFNMVGVKNGLADLPCQIATYGDFNNNPGGSCSSAGNADYISFTYQVDDNNGHIYTCSADSNDILVKPGNVDISFDTNSLTCSFSVSGSSFPVGGNTTADCSKGEQSFISAIDNSNPNSEVIGSCSIHTYPTCTPVDAVMSAWGACQSNGQQSRTVITAASCGGAAAGPLTQACNYVPACVAKTVVPDFGACTCAAGTSSGTQIRDCSDSCGGTIASCSPSQTCTCASGFMMKWDEFDSKNGNKTIDFTE